MTKVSVEEIFHSYKIDIDLELEHIIAIAKDDIPKAYEESINHLDPIKREYNELTCKPVSPPSYTFTVDNKTYDVRSFNGFNLSKYEDIKKKKGLSKEDKDILTALNKRKKDSSRVFSEEDEKMLIAIETKCNLSEEEKDKFTAIYKGLYGYEEDFRLFSDYDYKTDNLKKQLNRWEKIVYILSPDGPLIKGELLIDTPLPAVPDGALVLSIRQPWAYFILKGYKTIETRNWHPGKNFKIPQEIYIHATKPQGNPCVLTGKIQDYCSMVGATSLTLKFMHYSPKKEDFTYGKILGMATIVEVIEFKIEKHYSEYNLHHLAPHLYFNAKYGFRLKDIKPVKPVDTKGKLFFWKYLSA